VTLSELARLAPSRIIILGGPGAVADAVADQLVAYASDGLSRWAGADRYATAAAVSAAVFPGGADVVFVATGANFPDALAGGPGGGVLGGPILLTGRDSVPQVTLSELARLAPSRIIILGGPGAVADAVADQLATYVS
ncbi:MAG TPA: cell wall-binding repeat-containing protein, partial [Nitriliruptorales bacterium]